MELAVFHASLQAAKELASVVEIGMSDVKKLQDFGLGLDIISAATSGAIVLCVARFEEYLKSAAERSLQMYSRSQPPVGRSQLNIDLQVLILRKNISAAAQKTVHGQHRSALQIMSDVHDVAKRIADDTVWGDHAIETYSNPGSKTVAEIMGLLGVARPWRQIEVAFASLWTAHLSHQPGHKSVPSAENELESIISWRNISAHTSQAPSIGAKELFESIAYFEMLSTSIDSILETTLRRNITSLNSSPASWI